MESLLKIENLTLRYGAKVVFSGINAEGRAGELIALIGGNGRGKSTLLRSIIQMEKNGRNAKEMSELISFVASTAPRAEYLRVEDMLGVCSYHRTNWAGSLTSCEALRISRALQLVGLQGFEKRLCSTLSDGEFQRAAIASALVQDSRIILLDEPTAFLDIANKYLIAKLLQRIAKEGKLIVFSTHDLSLALQVCDKLWVMAEDGFYEGEPHELIKQQIMDKIFSPDIRGGVKFDPRANSFIFAQ